MLKLEYAQAPKDGVLIMKFKMKMLKMCLQFHC